MKEAAEISKDLYDGQWYHCGIHNVLGDTTEWHQRNSWKFPDQANQKVRSTRQVDLGSRAASAWLRVKPALSIGSHKVPANILFWELGFRDFTDTFPVEQWKGALRAS